jgi:hypothetical protein
VAAWHFAPLCLAHFVGCGRFQSLDPKPNEPI